MESPKKPERMGWRKLSTEELLDAQVGLLEWELKERDKQHDIERGIDHLTGLKNRKFFEQELEQSLKIIRGETIKEGKERREKPLFTEVALISIDIDHFKNINDTLGHPAGDEVLRGVSALLRGSVRETDIAARVGGEELMVLMRGADVQGAAHHAEELRAKIEQLSFDTYPELKVTASFGVVSSKASTDAKALYSSADKALYAAKQAGRNRVEVYNRG